MGKKGDHDAEVRKRLRKAARDKPSSDDDFTRKYAEQRAKLDADIAAFMKETAGRVLTTDEAIRWAQLRDRERSVENQGERADTLQEERLRLSPLTSFREEVDGEGRPTGFLTRAPESMKKRSAEMKKGEHEKRKRKSDN